MSHLHEKVSALVDGELTGGPRRRALDHLRRCGACRRELDETLALKQRLTGLCSVDPPSDLFAALGMASAVRQTPRPYGSQAAARGDGYRHRRTWRLLIGASSVPLVVLSVAYAVGGSSETATQQVTPPVDDLAAEFGATTAKDILSDAGVGFLAPAQQPSSSPVGTSSSVVVGLELPAAVSIAFGLAGTEGSDDSQAVHLLARAQQAPTRVGYVGVEQIQSLSGSPADVLTLSVQHVPNQGTTFASRAGGATATSAFVEQTSPDSPYARVGGQVNLICDAYDVSLEGSQLVLGRPSTVVVISAQAEMVARFWLDDETGLLLRRDLFDQGELVRSSGFTRLRVRTDGFFSHLPPAVEELPTSAISMSTAPALDDDGWALPQTLAGVLSLQDLHRVEAGSEVMQAVYSDGLSTVSVFEQRGSLDAGGLTGFSEQSIGSTPLYVRTGLVTTAVWESDGTVFTVVTDAPPRELQSIAADLPHAGPTSRPGAPARIRAGLSRLASLVGSTG